MKIKSTFFKYFTKVSLPGLLIWPFLLQTVGIVTLVSYLSNRSGEEAVHNVADRLLDQATYRVSDHLDILLDRQEEAVKTNYHALREGRLKFNDFKQLQESFWQHISFSPFLSSLGFANEQGEEIAYGRLLSQEIVEQASKLTGENLKIGVIYFQQIRPKEPQQRKFFLVDPQGKPRKLVYTMSIDIRTTPWYQAGKAARRQTWSPIFVSRIIPSLSIGNLAPIYDLTGKFQGVLNNTISLSEISTFLNNLNFSTSGQALIIERSGNLVATSTLEIPYVKHDQGPPTRLHATESKNALTRAIAWHLKRRGKDLREIKTPYHFQVPFEGQTLFAQVIPYRNSYGLDWLMVTMVPESEFTAEIHNNMQKTLLLCSLALVASIGISSITVHLISKPIRELNKAAKELSNGNFIAPKSTTAVTELSELTDSFSQMTECLQTSFDSIATQKAYFANLLEILPLGVAIHGTDGSTTYINQKGQQLLETLPLLDVTTHELNTAYKIYIGGTNQLYPTEELPAIQALKGQGCYLDNLEVELEETRLQGEAWGIPITNQQGEIISAIVVFQDITTQKIAQKILTDYNLKLEEDVKQRTLELEKKIEEQKQTEIALRESQKRLQQVEINLRKANEQLSRLVNLDGLTQIANRRCFNQILRQEWSRLRREKQPLSLLLLDIDYFKYYNDFYGHPMGDDCLVKIAQTIKEQLLLPIDLVARYGGEEFAVILPNTDVTGATTVASRIHQSINILSIEHQRSLVSNLVSVSIGITSIVPNTELTPEILITQADQALYSAKNQGRNQSALFSRSLTGSRLDSP